MIVVSGASGLVGLHLIRALSMQNLHVKALYHTTKPTLLAGSKSQYIEWVACDITKYYEVQKALTGAQYVYHAAAIISYDRNKYNKMYEVNVIGTENIVNVALDQKVKKLIFLSSIAAIHPAEEGMLIDENTPWDPLKKVSQYATTKHEAELHVWRAIAEGLPAVILNPGIILGEGNTTKSSTALFSLIQKGFAYYTKGTTAWVDVQDVVKAMILCMHSNIVAHRFLLSENNYSYQQIFQTMASCMQVKAAYKEASPLQTYWVSVFKYIINSIIGKEKTITPQSVANVHTLANYSGKKIQSFFPEFNYTPIPNCIKRVCGFLKQL